MPLRSKQTGQGLPIITPASSSAECQKNGAVTRSGRSVRPPSYLKDYVQTYFFLFFVKTFLERFPITVYTYYSSVFFKEGKV